LEDAKIKMAYAVSFCHPCGRACCAALQSTRWCRHVVIVELFSFWGDVGTTVPSGVPASFKVSFQGKVGNNAVENWVPSLLHWESLSSP